MIAALILAAGGSTRLGYPKQLATIANENLLHRTMRIAQEAACEPIIVVLGAACAEILAHSNLHPAQVVINSAWQQGMASSIHLGLQSIPQTAEGAILLTCDQPAVSAHHLSQLMATGHLTASSYADCRGVPAYIPTSIFPDLMNLTGNQGARHLLHTATAIQLPHGDLDIDTLADLERARMLFG